MTKKSRLKVTLACDGASCSFTEIVTLSRRLIGRPCPVCGANLLTKHDYELALATMKFTKTLGIKIVDAGTPGHFTLNPHGKAIKVTVP